jgi:hypothetical protein
MNMSILLPLQIFILIMQSGYIFSHDSNIISMCLFHDSVKSINKQVVSGVNALL